MNTQMNEENVPLKQCRSCPINDQWHPATPEYFYHNKSKKDRLNSQCKKCMDRYAKQKIKAEKPTNCAACGIPITQPSKGLKEFCCVEHQRIGRSYCKCGCGKSITQSPTKHGNRKQFYDRTHQRRYDHIGTISASWIEERNRTKCIVCGDPITQPKYAKKKFCGKKTCYNHYYRNGGNPKTITERWGTYKTETRKILFEIEEQISERAAKRVATAIDREYIQRDATSLYIPPDLLKDVLQSAKEHNRSYQQEVLYLIEQALNAQKNKKQS